MSGFGDRTAPRPWQIPSLRPGDEPRQVGWLELFFDLVFVVIVSVLAEDLLRHLSADGVAEFCLKFLPVFWSWNAVTFYTERFESTGLDNRLFTFLAILPVAGLAVWGDDGLGHNYLGFALSYVALRALNIGMWLRAARHNPPFRPAAFSFAGGFSVALVLILLSFGVDGGLRSLLWGVAVVLDILTPVIFGRTQSKLPPLSRDRYPERVGLLTMIILGEVVASVIGGVVEVNARGELTAATIGNAVLGVAIGFGMWWVYYDFIARRPPRPTVTFALLWTYLHYFVFVSVVIVGVAVEAAMMRDGTGALPPVVQTILLLGMAATLVSISATELTLDRESDEPTHPVASPAVKLLTGLLLGLLALVPDIPITVVLAACLLGLAIPAAYGARVWYWRVR